MVGAGSLLLQRGTPGQLALVSELRDRAAGSGVERAAARGLTILGAGRGARPVSGWV